MKKYWLQDNLGEYHIFKAKNDTEAGTYFWNSGDRAYDWAEQTKNFLNAGYKANNENIS